MSLLQRQQNDPPKMKRVALDWKHHPVLGNIYIWMILVLSWWNKWARKILWVTAQLSSMPFMQANKRIMSHHWTVNYRYSYDLCALFVLSDDVPSSRKTLGIWDPLEDAICLERLITIGVMQVMNKVSELSSLPLELSPLKQREMLPHYKYRNIPIKVILYFIMGLIFQQFTDTKKKQFMLKWFMRMAWWKHFLKQGKSQPVWIFQPVFNKKRLVTKKCPRNKCLHLETRQKIGNAVTLK